MSHDINCPYCNNPLDINHDDGYGYEEGCMHEQECGYCNKNFTYTTSISYYYEAEKADCLNGDKHIYRPSTIYPREYTKMECQTCDATRKPTAEEMAEILKS